MTTEVRPRYGTVTRADGTEETVVYRQAAGNPTEFYALHATDESRVVLRPGDSYQVDVIGPGQSVSYLGEIAL